MYQALSPPVVWYHSVHVQAVVFRPIGGVVAASTPRLCHFKQVGACPAINPSRCGHMQLVGQTDATAACLTGVKAASGPGRALTMRCGPVVTCQAFQSQAFMVGCIVNRLSMLISVTTVALDLTTRVGDPD